MPRFDAVLFDLDGTLLDSIDLILESYRHTLAAQGLPPQPDEVILAGLGTPLEMQFARWIDDSERVARLVEAYVEHNLSIHDRYVKPYPGVTEVVHGLHARATPMAIVTSKKRRGTVRGLAVLGLSDAFGAWITADDVERPKPHAEPVLKALAALGDFDPGRTLFIGDATHDVHAGKAAGVRTAAVLWGSGKRAELEASEPDHIVEDAAALHSLLLG